MNIYLRLISLKIKDTDFMDVAFAVGMGAIGADDGLMKGKPSLYPSNAIFGNSIRNDFVDYTSMTIRGELENIFTDDLYENFRRCK